MLKKFTDVIARVKLLQGDRANFELGRMLNMTPQTVDLYMRGKRKPSVEFILNVCSCFNVSADWLLGIVATNVIDTHSGVAMRINALKVDADRAASSINNLLNSITRLQEAVK